MATQFRLSHITQRGWIVLGIFAIAFILWVNSVTTPDQCKVPLEKMSQECVEFVYP